MTPRCQTWNIFSISSSDRDQVLFGCSVCVLCCVYVCDSVTDRQNFRGVGRLVRWWEGEFPSTQCLHRHKDWLTLLWTFGGGLQRAEGSEVSIHVRQQQCSALPTVQREDRQHKAAHMRLYVSAQRQKVLWYFTDVLVCFSHCRPSIVKIMTYYYYHHWLITEPMLQLCFGTHLKISWKDVSGTGGGVGGGTYG